MEEKEKQSSVIKSRLIKPLLFSNCRFSFEENGMDSYRKSLGVFNAGKIVTAPGMGSTFTKTMSKILKAPTLRESTGVLPQNVV